MNVFWIRFRLKFMVQGWFLMLIPQCLEWINQLSQSSRDVSNARESCRRYNYVSDPQFVNLCIVHQLMNDFMFLLEHIAQCTYRLYIEYFYVVKLSFSRKKEAKEISLMRPPRVFRAIFTDESLFKLLPNIHLHTLYSSKNILISFTIHI